MVAAGARFRQLLWSSLRRMRHLAPLAFVACSHAAAPAPTPAPATPATPRTIALPGAPADGVFLDYLAYDAAHHKVWIPAGGTGNVDVIDTTSGALTPIAGFATKEVERRGQKRLVGPSSATVGDGIVYVGNRGDSTVCAIDAVSLAKQGCVTLDSSPDGLQYVAPTKQVWVTTPRDKSIRILDVSAPAKPVEKDKITFDGEPEGFAVNQARGLFFTNLEDKDKTLAIDIKTHAISKTWEPHCGDDGPKGLAFDEPHEHLVVVCPDHLETLDAAHDGAMLGSLKIGDGLDAIDLFPGRAMIPAAAARAERMTIAVLRADGSLSEGRTIPMPKGARNAVITEDGTSYVANGPAGAILVVPPTREVPVR